MNAVEVTSAKEKEQRQEASFEIPRLLTRNLIPTLTQGLDASDLLECYALVRSAPLHGIANSTIAIHKMVLGIRFRPKGPDMAFHIKSPMELTLEFGAQRVGARLNDEATPIVQIEDSTSYVAWDNVGRVYFTRKLVKENFLSSYFMASISGAVLDELLMAAVEYSERRKVYQPFAVYSEEKGKVLQSSSSSDFTWFIWSHLAKLGVEVDPILPPPIYEVRLWVKSAKKVISEPAVAHQAAVFYQKLYNCLEAIATNNYGSVVAPESKAATNEVPSLEPTARTKTTNEPSSLPDLDTITGNLDDDERGGEDSGNSGGTDEESNRDDGPNENVRRRIEEGLLGEEFEDPESENDADEQSQRDPIKNSSSETEPNLQPGINGGPGEKGDVTSQSRTPSMFPSSSPSQLSMDTQDYTKDMSTHDEQTPEKEGPGQGVEETKQAADDAQKAADQAKSVAESEGDTKAADAAQAAADAAQAAATATSKAAAQAAMDSLLSRDGAMMSSIATACFTNPRFDIASIDVNGSVTIDAYLYRDSSFFYELELASPYIEVAKLNRELPKATLVSEYGSGGDTVDWILALWVVFLVWFMVLLICQQMGYCHFVGTIFKCQRWFFNPRKYDYEGELMAGHESGPIFFFGKDGIPLSMGGRRSTYSPMQQRESVQNVMANSTVDDDEFDLQLPSLPSPLKRSQQASVELEMTSLGSPPSIQLRRVNSNATARSNEEVDDSLASSLPVPERLLRNPDLVEMPDLKSRSKVAVPVGSSPSNFGEILSPSSFGDASTDESSPDRKFL